VLEILKYPDPRLAQKSVPVTQFDSALGDFLDQMAKTMYAADGVGLAAPQVGRNERFFIIDISPVDKTHSQIYEFINPVITQGEGKIVFQEGCLSVPGFSEDVSRKNKVTVNYQNRHGESQTMVAEGVLAVAIQHENDHIEGVLFIDRLSPLKRRFLKRKLEKQLVAL
jgi:peptide deformylase